MPAFTHPAVASVIRYFVFKLDGRAHLHSNDVENFLDFSSGETVEAHLLHAAIEPSVEKDGNLYVAKVLIFEEDGEKTSLRMLGHFASSDAAYSFALRYGTAFVEGQPLPIPPCHIDISANWTAAARATA